MTCPACHAVVPERSHFCPSCGAALAISSDETRLDSDLTRLADERTRLGDDRTQSTRTSTASGARSGTAGSGWLTSSGSIDHGRFEPGAVLDNRYRIIGLLGRGGMGEVYRADDLRLGQPVALKFLPHELATDTRRLAQFHNEVRTARQVSHPNVCRVYDIGEVRGDLYLSMEYVDGEDLAASLKRVGRFPEDRALELARQLAAGLAAAHERGVVHRDLKPANVMLDSTGKVRIMDFGLAAIGEVGDIRVGTPAYMAPEQIEGREVTAKSDIYALGLVLYELFTGRRAFNATTLPELLRQQSGPLPAPTEIVKGLDAAIERAILRCLERDPARRPSSALAVSAALPGGDPLAAALAAGETPSPEMVAAAGGEDAAISRGSGLAWLAAAAALLLATLAIGSRVSMFERTPLEKSPDVLADRAEQIRRSLGYTDRVADQAVGFTYNNGYLNWAKRQGAGADRWRVLASGRPAPILFWRRTSSSLLIPVSPKDAVSPSDPPIAIAGMTLVDIDTTGRLLRFVAAPPEVDPHSSDPPPAADWSAAFLAAGLDASSFHDVPPGRTPSTYADNRRAWEGTLPGTTIAVRVEGASFRGRPVSFGFVAPWTVATRDMAVELRDTSVPPVQVALVFALLAGAVGLARANLKSGRADRRGSFRLAAYMFFVMTAIWALSPHVSSVPDEWLRLLTGLAYALLLGAVMWIVYLALEPFVRRSWPTMLVGWTRLTSGRIADPRVARDLLLGVAFGAALTTINLAYNLLPVWFSQTEPMPMQPAASTLEGLRSVLLAITASLNGGLQNGLITALFFVLIYEAVDRIARRRLKLTLAHGVSTALAVAVAVVLSALGSDLSDWWAIIVFGVAGQCLVLFVLLRFGLLATIVMSVVSMVLGRIPLTLDSSKFYAANAWFALGLIAALAVAGYQLAVRQRATAEGRIAVRT